MSGLERLFRPIYWFLMTLGYAWLVLHLLLAAAIAFLLGYAARRLIWRRAWKTLADWRLTPTGIRTVLLLWEAFLLALSVWLGGQIGWWIAFTRREKILGGCAGALGFPLGHALAYRQDKEV